MPVSEDEKFQLLHSDAAWRMGVDAQLQGISSSLNDLVRIEEKQTSLMESIGELKRKSEQHDSLETDVRLLVQSVENIKESVEKIAQNQEEMRKEFDERLDALEAREARNDWATRSIERVIAAAAILIAIAANFVDFGD